jgi:uncharacterized protein (DUF433 family)
MPASRIADHTLHRIRDNLQLVARKLATPSGHANRYPTPATPARLPHMAHPLLERITIEAGKCGGRPCVRGTRMRVTDVLELLANEASIEEIVAEHPGIERADVLAAIAYAAHQTNHAVIHVA